MTKRMLIDATHAEETRVVVLDGNRLEDFDVETSTKKQLKGNIYLAKIVRVEPSLQAAFVEYGGGRHGFLAFGEIHPDYYQIPVADRQRLLALQAEEARAEAEAEDREDRLPPPRAEHHRAEHHAAEQPAVEQPAIEPAEAVAPDGQAPQPEAPPTITFGEENFGAVTYGALDSGTQPHDLSNGDAPNGDAPNDDAPNGDAPAAADAETSAELDIDGLIAELPPPETVGGDSDVFEGNGAEEARVRRTARFLRNYRIQEVIHRRQIMLVQVVKEERGTKGAALTTYISLAGRFCVLMPNSPRGGGISRKITSAADRRRLKEITAELEIPQGMGLIVRTAGANRPKPEIRRDCEYLMRLWDDIREHTMRSVAPALIYEEASLIKRTIRDVYSRDVDEVQVDGEEGWRAAHEFMRMLMPSHAKKVQLWRPQENGGQRLFSKHGVEAQLDSMLSPTVQLRSGGYLVINQAEALVAIDVNSGRSTRERGIEETALRTNSEAADEVARQLRLRDLAGLVVIDFIDMESRKHNGMVERRLKDALKNDRARIQLGHISHFGLLEMSRQRLRPSLAETSFVTCPHCGGLGHVRSVESAAIHVLRDIEEEGAKAKASLILVHAAEAIAMYILNNKRDRLADIEARYAMRVHFTGDATLVPPEIRIDRLKPPIPESERIALAGPVAPVAPLLDASEEEDEDIVTAEAEAETRTASRESRHSEPRHSEPGRVESRTAEPHPGGEDADPRRRRRRRRRGGRREDGTDGPAAEADGEAIAPADSAEAHSDEVHSDEAHSTEVQAAAVAEDGGTEPGVDPAQADQPSLDPAELDENGLPKGRRRGRRGGRRRRRDAPGEETIEIAAEPPPPVPAYVGPTPADPFGGHTYDIFDLLEQAEAASPPAPAASIPVMAAPVAVQETVAPTPEPEPIPALEPVLVAEPVLTAEPEAAMQAPSEPSTPEPSPAIRPIVIGQDPSPAAEPKRGWWRR